MAIALLLVPAGASAASLIDADLVYINQARHEVGMLLNPDGGVYIAFECGGESAEGKGPFLAPGSPINQEATSFTVTLDQLDSVQTPDEYEGEKGELLHAIPTSACRLQHPGVCVSSPSALRTGRNAGGGLLARSTSHDSATVARL